MSYQKKVGENIGTHMQEVRKKKRWGKSLRRILRTKKVAKIVDGESWEKKVGNFSQREILVKIKIEFTS